MNIKKIFNFLKILIIVILFSAGLTYAAISIVPNGGTGVGTISGLIQGNGTSPFTPVTIGTGLSLSSGTLSATGGGGTVTSVTAPSPLIATGTTAIDILWQDPTHDGMLGFDEFDGTPSFWNIGTGLSYDHGTHTISSTGTGGTVTSVTATSPLTGGTITTTGSVGCQTASGSQAGCLSSTDWTTFNNKGSVSSVALSGGATGLTVTGSPITTSGTIQLGGTLGRSNGGTGTNMGTDPVFNRLWGWDVVDGKIAYMTLGNGLTYDHATHTIDSFVPLNQVGGALAQGAQQDSFNNHIEWAWNSLGNNFGLKLETNGSQALTGQNVLWVSADGLTSTANQSTTAARFTNTHTGTNASNTAAQFTASGGTSNTAIDITNGNINQAGGNIFTGGTITLNNSTTITGGGVNIRTPTTNSGSAGKFVQTDGSGNWDYVTAPGSPSVGSFGDVQLADGSGAFTASANYNFNTGSQLLSLTGAMSINNSSTGIAGLSYTSGSQPFLTGSSDSNQAWLLAGNGFSGISFTSGGVANNEVGMYENDNSTSIATYTFRDDEITGDPMYFFANKHFTYDINTETTCMGDTRFISNGTKVCVDDANTATVSTNAVATPTMNVDTSGSTTVTIANGTRGVYVDPTVAISSPITVTMPDSPVDGQEVVIGYGGQIPVGLVVNAAVTYAPNVSINPQVVLDPNNGTAKASAGDSAQFKYRADIFTWYRIN